MEQVETINRRLSDIFGTIFDLPRYRIVWSDDQFEKRWTKYTAEGLELLFPEVRELPKYRQWAPSLYILERLMEVPEGAKKELTEDLSYEPIWVFRDDNGNPLPPHYGACKFVIEEINKNVHQAGQYTKYKDPATDPNWEESERARLKALENELFGDRSMIQENLADGSAIIKP